MKSSIANWFVASVGLLSFALLAGCSSGSKVKVVSAATAEQRATTLDQVKALEGTWVGKDEKGVEQVMAIFSVGSAGTSVREIMFPGTPHEMTNMYHMDGGTLVMTHYCAAGNQPRLRSLKSAPGRIEMVADSVTNFTTANEYYMGRLTLVMPDKDTLVEEWASIKDGKEQVEHMPKFEWKRKK